jgi:serine/threonine protein kinase
VHCDLKPQNVLLDDDMVAHVADFGIGKVFFADKQTEYSSTASGLRGLLAIFLQVCICLVCVNV